MNNHPIVFFGLNPLPAVKRGFAGVKKRIPRLDRFGEKAVIGAGLGIGAGVSYGIHRMGNYNTQKALEATKNQYGIKDELPN